MPVKYLQISTPTDMDVHLHTLLEKDFYMTSEVGKLQVFLMVHTSHIFAE